MAGAAACAAVTANPSDKRSFGRVLVQSVVIRFGNVEVQTTLKEPRRNLHVWVVAISPPRMPPSQSERPAMAANFVSEDAPVLPQ